MPCGFPDPRVGADRLSRRWQDDAAQPAAEGSGARRHGGHHQRIRRRRDRPSAGRAVVGRRHPAFRRLPVLHGARRTRRHAGRPCRPAADRPHRAAEARRHRDHRPRRSGAGAAVDHGASGACAGLPARRRRHAGRRGQRRRDARRPCRGGEAGRRRRPHRHHQDRSGRAMRMSSSRCARGCAASIRARNARCGGRQDSGMPHCSNAGSTIRRPRPPTCAAGWAKRRAHAHDAAWRSSPRRARSRTSPRCARDSHFADA